MHEASVVEALVGMLSKEAALRGGGRITKIRLVVGEATGYMAQSLEFYLGLLGKGTALDGAGLELRYVKPLLRCRVCGHEFERRRFTFECPRCGGAGRLTETGREFFVESIDLEASAS